MLTEKIPISKDICFLISLVYHYWSKNIIEMENIIVVARREAGGYKEVHKWRIFIMELFTVIIGGHMNLHIW